MTDLSQWRKIPRHPLSEVFGDMTEVEFESIVADMQQHGYDPKQQVWLFEGKALDGWHRLRAGVMTHKMPTFENFKGTWEEAELFVIRRNLNRRHLNASQRGLIAGRMANLSHGGDRRSKESEKANLPVGKVAEKLEISEKTADFGKKVAEHGGKALQEAVMDKTVSISDAASIASHPRTLQLKAIRAVRSGKAKTARAALAKPSDNGKQDDDETCPTCHGSGKVSKKKLARMGFIPPSVDEVNAYAKEISAGVDGERFVDYYSANGWKVGKSKMVDWKAAVRNWKHNQKGRGNGRISRVEAPAGKYDGVGIVVGTKTAPKK